jgi:chromosomal replication initiation ATPase DnaA
MTSATINDILLAIQNIKRVGVREIRSPSREIEVRDARLLFYFVASQCFAKPTVWIAKAVNRSSATVGEAVLRMKRTTAFPPELIDAVEDEVEKIVKARQGQNSMEMR